MTSPRKQPASGPRSSRGLELCLWAAILSLAAYGVLHTRTGSQAPGKTAAEKPVHAESELKGESQAASARYSIREKSPRQILLEKAVAAIQSEEDSEKREEMLSAFADQIPVADIQFTLQDLHDLGLAGSEASRRLLRRWAGSDGQAAAAWSEQLPAGQVRADALSAVAIEWADAALKDAAAWAGRLPDEVERQTAVLAVANEAVRSDPVAAVRLVNELPASRMRDWLLEHATMQWASQDGEEAAAWARQIADVNLREKLLRDVAVGWADSDPVAAGTLAVSGISNQRRQADAIVSIVQRWAQQQPEAAAAWVEQFPEGELKQTAMENLVMLSQNKP